MHGSRSTTNICINMEVSKCRGNQLVKLCIINRLSFEGWHSICSHYISSVVDFWCTICLQCCYVGRDFSSKEVHRSLLNNLEDLGTGLLFIYCLLNFTFTPLLHLYTGVRNSSFVILASLWCGGKIDWINVSLCPGSFRIFI